MYVVVVYVETTYNKTVYSERFNTLKAASAAAEFWSFHGAAAVIEDEGERRWLPRSEQ